MPLGDVIPQVLEVLAVTNPGGKVRVTLPVFAGIIDEVRKEIDAEARFLVEWCWNVANES